MTRIAGALVLAAAVATPLVAQQPPAPTPLAVGQPAPDFRLMGGTAAGVVGPLSLEDFQDKTLVIAFFYRARSRG